MGIYMRIGIDASFLRKPATGIGQVVLNFLEELNTLFSDEITNRQHEIVLYVQEEPVGVSLPASFAVKIFLPRLWRRDDVLRQWLWEEQVSREAVRDGCEVFVSLSQSATIFDDAFSVRHIMLVHDIIPRIFPIYRQKFSQELHWRAIERGIRAADLIVAVSQSTRNDLIAYFEIDAQRIAVAHPGIAAVFEHVPLDGEVGRVLTKYGLKQGYLYHGGGLEIRKNTEGVLRAYAALYQEHKKRLSSIPPLVISGTVHAKTNVLATDVASLIAELGLGERVKLLGRVPERDLPALYRGAKMFVYPSRYEGFGLPVLEAMSMKCPVIASSVASLPEVCGEAALLVDPEDFLAIAIAMDRLLTEKKLREILVQQGQQQARRFSYAQFTERIARLCFASL